MSYLIAVVDDEAMSLTNAKNIIRDKGMKAVCLRSGNDLLEFVEKKTPDLILLDILMPDMDGFETYRALRQFEEKNDRSRIPVIFLTGEDNNETERRGLKAGASDFIHKPFDEGVLIKRIVNTIENSRTIESLTEKATLDRLTGLLNKASGTEKVSKTCKESPGALMILDLDSFKLVNDIYGHDMGDRILTSLAGIIRMSIRSEDIICRIGGDEFMAFLPGLTKEEPVRSIVEKINARITEEAAHLMGKDHGIPLGVSAGVALCHDDDNDYQILFRCADSALYDVKRNGKHDCKIYDPDILLPGPEEDLDSDLERVVKIISERGDGKGAMLLGQEAFSWNYRFIERFLARYGGSATRILFSLSSDEESVIFNEMISEFGNVLKESLRRSDIILQWQHNRYFAVLPLYTESESNNVIDRIMNAWTATGYGDRIRVSYAMSKIRKESYESGE